MIIWWENLKLRERLILAVAVLVVIFVLLDSLVIEQYRIQYGQLDEQIEQAREDLQWMRQAVQRLPSKTGSSGMIKSGRVVTFIDQQISRQRIKKNMQQMTPIGNHSARVRLSDVEFDRLLQFLNVVADSLVIEEVRLLPSEQQGLVNVSLVVGNGMSNS